MRLPSAGVIGMRRWWRMGKPTERHPLVRDVPGPTPPRSATPIAGRSRLGTQPAPLPLPDAQTPRPPNRPRTGTLAAAVRQLPPDGNRLESPPTAAPGPTRPPTYKKPAGRWTGSPIYTKPAEYPNTAKPSTPSSADPTKSSPTTPPDDQPTDPYEATNNLLQNSNAPPTATPTPPPLTFVRSALV